MNHFALQFPPSHWYGGRYSFLLVSLILTYTVDPFVHNLFLGKLLLDVFLVGVWLLTILSLGNRRLVTCVLLIIFVPELFALAAAWVGYEGNSLEGGLIGSIRILATIAFFGYASSVIMGDVLRGKEPTADKISGAICVYLMLGFMWAFIYLFIEHRLPGSFAANNLALVEATEVDDRQRLSVFVYYSFVTLATLGYGDITPIGAHARTMSWLEAVTGQLFLAVFIAGLVGQHLSDRQQKKSAGEEIT